jgi:heme A synthase
MLLVIEREHRFVAIGVGSLYAVLSVLFFFEERPRERKPPRT